VRLIQGGRAKRAYLSHPTRAAPRGDPAPGYSLSRLQREEGCLVSSLRREERRCLRAGYCRSGISF
jgi:hypothetical protein